MNFALGTIIAATTNDESDFFYQSKIVLNQHSATGIYGLMLDQPLDLFFNHLEPSCNVMNISVYNGGPVGLDEISFLHNLPNHFPEAMQLNGKLYWGGYFSKLISALNNKIINPLEIMIFKGYCGWDIKQLTAEFDCGDWIICKKQLFL